MNTLQKTLIALATGSLLSVSAQAAVNYGTGYAGQPYIGAKIGQYDPNDADADSAMSYGVYGGYKFTPEFAVEAEYLTTNDGDIVDNDLLNAQYSADVYGLYGSYDYAFPNSGMYAKGRLGFAKNEIEVEATDKVTNVSGTVNVSDSGVAGGLGLGYNVSPNASVEALYNWYPTIEGDSQTEDLDVSGITLGAHFKF